jgi:hypothetical protein
MMEWIDKIIYTPFQPFVWHPERIAVVAVTLLIIAIVAFARRLRAWPLFVAASAWAALVPWEYHCKVREANIRIDLLSIWPLLVIITGWGLIAGFRRRRLRGHTDDSNAA